MKLYRTVSGMGGHLDRPGQRGAAALTVVMVLFFIMALVAAYANRTLVFEQKTSANTYRATQAMEAGEAGIEWAVAMLNGGRVDGQCSPSSDAASPSFRQRYLSVSNDGHLVPTQWVRNGVPDSLVLACVRNGATWACSCPRAAIPALEAPTILPAPSFGLRFGAMAQPGVVFVRVDACSSLGTTGSECFRETMAGTTDAEAQVVLDTNVGFVRALPVLPTATLTVGRQVRTTAELQVANVDPKSGQTVRAGDTVSTSSSRYLRPPGTSGNGLLASDASLRDLVTEDRLFVSLFGMPRNMFQRQPGTYRLSCSSCSGADLATALNDNPGRMLWVAGDLSLDAAGTLGTAAAPLMLMVDGRLTLSQATVLNGLVYARDVMWDAPAGAALVGGMVVENDFIASTAARLAYDAEVLALIQRGHGSFVRVPGSWKDGR